MTRHAWAYAYRDALGAHQRCDRCGMLRSWPGAAYECPGAVYGVSVGRDTNAHRRHALAAQRRAEARQRAREVAG